MPKLAARLAVVAIALVGVSCVPTQGPRPTPPPAPVADWALAIHGGAGTVRETELTDQRRGAYEDGLGAALDEGARILDAGGAALDAVARVVEILEDDPAFNAGRGAVFTHDGDNELDAAIMEGDELRCGAVAGLRRVRNPVRLARLVMERSGHVFLIGEGAEAFGWDEGLEPVDQDYFFTQRRYDALQRRLRDAKHGTVGAVALDREGNLAAATSTGGLTGKRFGRVGDVPVIGAGTYAANDGAAVSCTGIGEEFIRVGAAKEVSDLVRLLGLDVREAARVVIEERLSPGDGGLIAVDARGVLALEYSTVSMLRGAADSSGRREVRIWE